MYSKVGFLFFIILLLNILIINGEECRCLCCPRKPCDVTLLPNVFYVERCWHQGGRSCLRMCTETYPNECNTGSSRVIPACRASSIDSKYFFITIIMVFIYHLFIN